MNLIVAVDENWGIGYEGDLLIKLSEDLKYFKRVTTGHVVVMGRVTFESLPGQKPLKNRTNVVLTRHASSPLLLGGGKGEVNDIIICHTVEEVLDFCRDKETFIIGGEQIYKLFIPYCKRAYITKIHSTFKADKHLPKFVESSDWRLAEKSEVFYTEEGNGYQFLVYERGN